VVAKNRNGSLDTIQLRFIGRYGKFIDLENSLDDNGKTTPSPAPNPSPEVTAGSVFRSRANQLFGSPDPNDSPF
jgi:replicative DNA helicase